MNLLRDIKYFIRNIIVLRKGLWEYRSFDWYGLLKINELLFRDMANHQREHDIHEDAQKVAKELDECAELTRLLAGDDFFDMDSFTTKYGRPDFKNCSFKWENEDKYSEEEFHRDLELHWKKEAEGRAKTEKELWRRLRHYRNWWD